MKTRAENSFQIVKQKFNEKKALISHLEGLYPDEQVVEGYKLLSQDANELKELYEKVQKLTIDMDNAENTKNAIKFFDTFEMSRPLALKLNELQYLQELSEDMIYQNYLTLWPTRTSLGDLSTEDKFHMINMKVRSLNERFQGNMHHAQLQQLSPPD